MLTFSLTYPELFFVPVHRLNEEGLTEEEQETLCPLLAQSDKLDTPLRLALFVSPLCLLLPKSLHKSRNDNSKIIAVGLMPIVFVCMLKALNTCRKGTFYIFVSPGDGRCRYVFRNGKLHE
jgi:hypothetical protein